MKNTMKTLALTAAAVTSLTAAAAVSNGQKYGDWQGVCQGSSCGIVQVQNNEKNVPVGRVAIRRFAEAGNTPVALILLPLGVNLQAGIGVAVDGGQVARIAYDFCDQAGCQAALPLKDDVLAKVKAGKKLQVAAFVEDKQQMVVFSLSGISKALQAL